MYYLNGGNNNCDMICSMEAIVGKCELEIQAKLRSKKQRDCSGWTTYERYEDYVVAES